MVKKTTPKTLNTVTYTVTVTGEELATIGVALGLMPFNQVSVLIGKLQSQINKAEADVKP